MGALGPYVICDTGTFRFDDVAPSSWRPVTPSDADPVIVPHTASLPPGHPEVEVSLALDDGTFLVVGPPRHDGTPPPASRFHPSTGWVDTPPLHACAAPLALLPFGDDGALLVGAIGYCAERSAVWER